MTEPRYITNGYHVAAVLGGWYIVPVGHGFSLRRIDPTQPTGRQSRTAVLGKNGDKDRTAGTFAECAALAASRGTPGPWYHLKGNYSGHEWFPAESVAKAKAIKLRWHTSESAGGLIKFDGPGVGCTVTIHSDFGHSRVCGRLSVTEGTEAQRGEMLHAVGDMVYRCSRHQKVIERRRAASDERRARYEERRAADEREAETRRACGETLERLRPLLTELGIHPQTVTVGEAGERIGILLPAEAAELLVGKAVELEQIMSEGGL